MSSLPTKTEVMADLDWGYSEADEIENAKWNHAHYPARFAACPECNLFSAHPWQTSFGTQNGTTWAWGSVCKEHGPWTEST